MRLDKKKKIILSLIAVVLVAAAVIGVILHGRAPKDEKPVVSVNDSDSLKTGTDAETPTPAVSEISDTPSDEADKTTEPETDLKEDSENQQSEEASVTEEKEVPSIVVEDDEVIEIDENQGVGSV